MMRFGTRFGYACDPDEVDSIIARIENPGQCLRSDYFRTIDCLLTCFPPEQVLIGFYDAILDRREELLNEIFKFLGIPKISYVREDVNERVNSADTLEMPSLIRDHLLAKYREPILAMSHVFGEYAIDWELGLGGITRARQARYRSCYRLSDIIGRYEEMRAKSRV